MSSQGTPHSAGEGTMLSLEGLQDDETLSGLREDILVLSWLIVLLRISDEATVRCSWTHETKDIQQVRELSIDRQSAEQHTIAGQLKSVRNIIAPTGTRTTEGEQRVIALTAATSETIPVTLRLQRTADQLVLLPGNAKNIAYDMYIDSLLYIVRVSVASTNTQIRHLLSATSFDLDRLWTWNHALPPLYQECMHDRITKVAAATGSRLAIDSWDGTLTYDQVEKYASHTAYLLQQLNATVGDVIPVCFEKSRWTIVAVLAVMKTGATFVLMDPALPVARLQNMAAQVAAKTILCSHAQRELASAILPDDAHLVIEEAAFQSLLQASMTVIIPSSAIMYIIFTSGSTGHPKGVTISFETYTSSAIHRAAAVGYHAGSRVLDFASYAFDVSIDSMLLTLGAGGCLCVPSDHDRMNDINGVMREMRITYAGLTPSVARILEPEVISSLEFLGLGGEAVSAREANIWGKVTRIVIGYGPCECTIGCTINSNAAQGRDYISIGPGNGAAMWIVDPEDHSTLMPLGAVGELLVEGPIVGQGYLNDPEKTASVFIEDPEWLVAGHSHFAGRRGRLYKTGDLGRYDSDGSSGIVFVGRKDTQVKLRGQRVELGEIESQLRALLPLVKDVVVEIIKPASGAQSVLVAFLAVAKASKHGKNHVSLTEPSPELVKLLSSISGELGKVLPIYMLPTSYIAIAEAPVLISGKVDRKTLRQFGTTLDLQQIGHGMSGEEARALNSTEDKLARAWSSVLPSATNLIPESNFLVLGGDSVLAMHMIPTCRSLGLELSVADIFASPTLSAMAEAARATEYAAIKTVPAFGLSQGDIDAEKVHVALLCGVSVEAVEDLYPCTPIQQALFTFSMRSEEPYMAQRIARIPDRVRVEAWKSAWEQVAHQHSILRTRIVQRTTGELAQAVLQDTIQWRTADDLEHYLSQDRDSAAGLGDRLARYAVVKDHSTGERYMVWSIHHLIYDGWSEPLLLHDLCLALDIKPLSKSVPMQNFVSYLTDIGYQGMHDYWSWELQGATGHQFPLLPHRDYVSTQDKIIERSIILPQRSSSAYTTAAIIRAAWSLIAARHTGNYDVVFGETFSGRDIALPGVENIIGPLIATVPVRVAVKANDTIEQLLASIQQGAAKRTPYQHMGMQNIRLVSEDAQIACETGTGLVVQPRMAGSVATASGFQTVDVVRETLNFNPYPLMLVCGLQENGFRVCAGFDSTVIEVPLMERMLAQLDKVCTRIIQDPKALVKDVSIMPDTELALLYTLNATAPLDLVADPASVLQVGSAYPPISLSWVVDQDNSSILLPFNCPGELCIESHMLSGAAVEVPWLPVGKRGKITPTGHIVKLSPTGSISYIGDKASLATSKQSALAQQAEPTTQPQLTPVQETLRKHWAALLKIESTRIGLNDSFFRLGGDSVLAMKLSGLVRADGFDLSVANVFRNMRLKHMAACMNPRKKHVNHVPKYTPFSLVEGGAQSAVLTRGSPSKQIQDAAPVTDSQDLDIRATVSSPRTSVQYTILYFEQELDQQRLHNAWQQVVERHEILRTVFIEHEQRYYQIVFKNMGVPLASENRVVDIKAAVKNKCLQDINADCSLGSTFVKAFSIQGEGHSAFVLRLSHAQYDGVSLPALLKDLEDAYQGKQLTGTSSFCKYIALTETPSIRTAAVSYWKTLLAGSRPTHVPALTASVSDKCVLKSLAFNLSTEFEGFTVATAVTTAWALVLARQTGQSDVTFGIVTSGLGNGLLKSADINGPCYQLAPTRVRFEPSWTAVNALRAVQDQVRQSAEHDFLGHETIARQCTDWAVTDDVFGSLVHYQEDDGYEAFDFAGVSCKADAIKPHGDAVTPLKVVTYVEKATSYIGIAGSERDTAVVQDLLQALEQAVHDLADPSTQLLRVKAAHKMGSPLASD